MEKMLISGVASDTNISRISLIGIEDRPGMAFKIFSLLAKEKISVDIILQSIGREGTKDISFTIAKADLHQTLNIIKENQEALTIKEIKHNENVAKISVVGAGMAANAGVASLMFEALYDVGININMISTSEIKISVLIDVKHLEDAVRAIHDKFKDATNNFRN